MNNPSFWIARASLLAAMAAVMVSAQAHAAAPGAEPLTREQVRAELVRARAAGELASPGDLAAPVRQAILDAQRAHRALTDAAQAQRAASEAQVQAQAAAPK
jgi:hypothetical protein